MIVIRLVPRLPLLAFPLIAFDITLLRKPVVRGPLIVVVVLLVVLGVVLSNGACSTGTPEAGKKNPVCDVIGWAAEAGVMSPVLCTLISLTSGIPCSPPVSNARTGGLLLFLGSAGASMNSSSSSRVKVFNEGLFCRQIFIGKIWRPFF